MDRILIPLIAFTSTGTADIPVVYPFPIYCSSPHAYNTSFSIQISGQYYHLLVAQKLTKLPAATNLIPFPTLQFNNSATWLRGRNGSPVLAWPQEN